MKLINLTSILIITTLLLNSTKSKAQCHIDDWTALKALYESTDGDNWIDNTGWEQVQTSSPPTGCNLAILYGVQLDNASRVNSIDLRENQLSGSIPPEIGNLSSLIFLRLQLNQLNESIPTEIGNLLSLTDLRLFGNQLSGNIPNEISNLNSLTVLWLFNNQLSGSIPTQIGNLSNLTHLRLDGNQLSGNIPTVIGNLDSLTHLYLHSNNLSGSIPTEITSLSNLTVLWLQLNQLSGSIPNEIDDLTSLTDLRLFGNQLSGSIPFVIGNLNELTYLLIGDNQLSGNIPTQIGNLTGLIELWLFSNQLEGSIPTQIGNLINLTHLRLNGNLLSGSIPKEISFLSNLIYLNLSSNELSGLIPLQLSDLKCNQVILNDNNLSGTVPEFISFNELYVNNNNFSCDDLAGNFNSNNETGYFAYSPQIYGGVQSYLIDTNIVNNLILKTTELPVTLNNPSYQWKKNDANIVNSTDIDLTINNLQLSDAGMYTLHVTDDCVPDIEFISKPYYVIYPGFDFYSQPVEYNEIMVEFDNPDETEKYEDEILYNSYGWVKKACNCNRELYLWQFPSTEEAVAALLGIDRKTKALKRRTKPSGGFNNNISIGETGGSSVSYNLDNDAFNKVYPDSVKVFILDSGLDHMETSSFLYEESPVDSCYNIDKSSGYSYIDSLDNDSTVPISTNYKDSLWHGTFGYQTITDQLNTETNIKVVPLKIFNNKGEGNLFDLTCALYHAIDHDADIINLSAGYQGEPSHILENAIYNAQQKGIFITTAAGNDTLNIDSYPQYPAYYAGKYYVYETIDDFGNEKLDSIQFDQVISVASIDQNNNLSKFSNYGKESVTLATYGENIHSYGLDVVASGTSMSTYFATKALAIEIAKDRTRSQKKIWDDFEQNWLINNDSLKDKTRTSMQIKLELVEAIIYGCTNPESLYYFPYATHDDGSCLTSAISQIDKEANFKMYPNPSSDLLNLSFNKNLTYTTKKISIFNSIGKLIQSINLGINESTFQLNCKAFPKGLYLLNVETAKHSESRKIIVK